MNGTHVLIHKAGTGNRKTRMGNFHMWCVRDPMVTRHNPKFHFSPSLHVCVSLWLILSLFLLVFIRFFSCSLISSFFLLVKTVEASIFASLPSISFCCSVLLIFVLFHCFLSSVALISFLLRLVIIIIFFFFFRSSGIFNCTSAAPFPLPIQTWRLNLVSFQLGFKPTMNLPWANSTSLQLSCGVFTAQTKTCRRFRNYNLTTICNQNAQLSKFN